MPRCELHHAAAHPHSPRSQMQFMDVLNCVHVNICNTNQAVFFSSSVADVALMARSLHVSKQTKLCTRTKSPWNKQIDVTTKRKPQTHHKRRPANPPARLAFRQRKQRSKQQKTNQKQKTGPEPKQKHPPNRFAIGRSGKSTASLSKACKNELCIAAAQADMKTLALKLTLA